MKGLPFVAIVALAGTCLAQPSLPGCEPGPEVRKVFHEKLSSTDLLKLKYVDRVARQHEVLDGLIARYPQELAPYQRLIDFVRYEETDQFPALQARFREQAAQHPNNPLALYLAGVVLDGTDTPESIRLLKEAHLKAPGWAWPNLKLAEIYSSGQRANKENSAEYLRSFLSACPAAADLLTQIVVGRLLSRVGDPALQIRTAAALRARLASDTVPDHLRAYEPLWALEFRSQPAQEHAALRKQLVQDLKRIKPLNPNPDVYWMEFLRRGYQQSGADEATTTALDDRILKEFPYSQYIPNILYERWEKTHKKPEDPLDAAWPGYNQARKEAFRDWIRDFPDVVYLSRSTWFHIIQDDDKVSEQEGTATAEHYLTSELEYGAPDPSPYLDVARFLVEHKWRPERALELLHKAQVLLAKEQEQEARDDNRSAEDIERTGNYAVYEQQTFEGLLLRAALQAHRPQESAPVRASVEGTLPSDRTQESNYWLNRARLAVLENRKADGLTYYQLALQTRSSPPAPKNGRLRDDLTDEARALWKDVGGTEIAWNLWSKPAAAKTQVLVEGRWEKAKKQMPSFELADLSGKIWKLKTVEGRSVLINVWATWCGPCNAELPHLQKLYEATKDRPDFQILTFNVDESPGVLEPFMKKKGYTFPVLPAYGLVENLLDGIAIPQNWVVDPEGSWRWTQLGFDGAPDWAKTVIQRLESVK